MTKKNAKFRPQLVDITPSDFAPAQPVRSRRAAKGSKLSVAAIASSVLRSANRSPSAAIRRPAQGKVSHGFRSQSAGGGTFQSRPSTKPSVAQTPLSGAARHAGAVRNSSLTTKQPTGYLGKLSVAILAITSVIVWTASDSDSQTETIIPTDIAKASVVPAPDFFFADKTEAIALADTKATTPQSGEGKSTTPIDFKDPAGGLANVDSAPKTSTQPIAALPEQLPTLPKQVDHDQVTDPVPTVQTGLAAITADANDDSVDAIDPLVNTAQAETLTTAIARASANGELERKISVAKGNTLSGILNANGVKIDQLSRLLANQLVNDNLSNLNVDQILELTLSADGSFRKLTTRVSEDKRINIDMVDGVFEVSEVALPLEKTRTVATGSIEQSLYLAAEKANLKQSTIMELANIFQWELDFARDIRRGDHFSLVYDKLFREGQYIGDGDILAAEFVRGGKTHTAIRFTNEEGVVGYYSPEGKSKRRTFMRHPVDVVRITSKFNPNRLHPVLHQIRAHRGVDYGSPYGSPIYATADGRVTFSGSKNAYGNTVVLKHGEKFSTLYAHMSKISGKSKVGKRVSQGDVIGYVGNSGRVTGTHLHYEFRVNNKQIDPLKVELPAAQPIDSKYLKELQQQAKAMIALMDSATPARDDGRVASAAK